MESYVYATEGMEYCSKMSSDVTGCDDLRMTFRQRDKSRSTYGLENAEESIDVQS
jgi:hypothetical protein